jgi:hypothetical protein
MIQWGKLQITSLGDLKKVLPDDYLEIEEGDYPAMADTVGSLVDKLSIVNLKMWWNQEGLYEIRRMDEGEFVAKYGEDLAQVHKIIKICCDMNVLRSQLIDEIDDRLAKIAETMGLSPEDIRSLRLVAPSHKSY